MSFINVHYNMVTRFSVNVGEFSSYEEMFQTIGKSIDVLEQQYGGVISHIGFKKESYITKVNGSVQNLFRITQILIEVQSNGVGFSNRIITKRTEVMGKKPDAKHNIYEKAEDN